MTCASDVGNRDIGAPHAEASTCDIQGPSRISQGPHVPGKAKTVLPNLCDEMTECLHDDNSEEYDDVLQVDRHLISSLAEHVNNEESRTPLQVKGRLRKHIAFWEDIQAPAFIIECIQDGYKIPFFQTPPRASFANNRSALQHHAFVTDSINELLVSGRIVQVPQNQLIVINPLSVAIQQNKGKKRLILDLRYVNKHIYKQKIKFDDWRTGLIYFQKPSYFTKFDLKSGYHHLDIFRDHQPFLGFAWPTADEKRKYFMFTVLPFGLSSAPYIFTKLVRPLVKHWRAQGISSIVYLDDGIDMEGNLVTSEHNSTIIQSDLHSSGFLPNQDKCVWQPTQEIDWLGIQWNGLVGKITISPHRIESILHNLQKILSDPHISARKLASIVGKIVSTGPVTQNLARIMTRHSQMSVVSAQDWDTPFQLDAYCTLEFEFWKTNLKQANERYFSTDPCPSKIIYSDASQGACAAHISGEDAIAHRMFTANERDESSTYRELVAIKFAVDSFTPLLRGAYVKWLTDSQSAAKIAQVGSMKFSLHELAFDIFSTCLKADIKLDIQWIPRSLNEKADYLSKIIDFDDWELDPAVFQDIEEKFGPHSIDCFASYQNCKVSRFFSRFWNPGTSGVDAFFQSWGQENCLVVPPVAIASRVIIFMFQNKARGTLVVPYWPSAPFWPLLISRFTHYVGNSIHYKGNTALRHGSNTNSLLGSSAWTGSIVACRLDFSQCKE